MKKINKSICGISQELFNKDFAGRYLIEPDDLVEIYQDKRVSDYAYFNQVPEINRTHKAFLIKSSIEPIEKDSFEKLTKSLCVQLDSVGVNDADLTKYYERAKALLQSEDSGE